MAAKSFVVRADEKLTAFPELECAARACGVIKKILKKNALTTFPAFLVKGSTPPSMARSKQLLFLGASKADTS
jgi:hypothetical protein